MIRHKLHRHQDANRLRDYNERKANLRAEQERGTLERRLRIQSREKDRQLQALEKVEKRELASLSRDLKQQRRVQARETDEKSISLENVAGLHQSKDKGSPDLLKTFDRARQKKRDGPDLMAEFDHASRIAEAEKGKGGSGEWEHAGRPDIERGGHGNDPDRGH